MLLHERQQAVEEAVVAFAVHVLFAKMPKGDGLLACLLAHFDLFSSTVSRIDIKDKLLELIERDQNRAFISNVEESQRAIRHVARRHLKTIKERKVFWAWVVCENKTKKEENHVPDKFRQRGIYSRV